MAAVTICSNFGAPQNKVWHGFHCFPIYFPLGFYPIPLGWPKAPSLSCSMHHHSKFPHMCFQAALSVCPSSLPQLCPQVCSLFISLMYLLSLAWALLGKQTYRNGRGGLLLKESMTESPVVRRRWKSIDTIIIASVICYPAKKFVYKSSAGPLHHSPVLHTLLLRSFACVSLIYFLPL